MTTKTELRDRLRKARFGHVAALPDATRALLFHRPPTPVTARIPDGATIGLYSAMPGEAPTAGYAKWFHERGHVLALPWFEQRDHAMMFRRWWDPHVDEVLEAGPFAIAQPDAMQDEVVPEVVFVPLLGFTASGERLGQGGGHYDRWLAANPDVIAIGLAWDCQLVETLPVEAHDRPLEMIVTPTRCYEVEQ